MVTVGLDHKNSLISWRGRSHNMVTVGLNHKNSLISW